VLRDRYKMKRINHEEAYTRNGGRLIIDALRRAGKPQGLQEITSALLTAGGYGEAARASLSSRVRGNLAYLEGAAKITKTGKAASAAWSLPQ
jgi:hypothetical protein